MGAYPRPRLTDLIERRRELFEYWAHEASFVPVALHPLLRWRMEAAGGHAWGEMVRIQRDLPDYVAKVFAEVSERGPISAAELVDGGEKSGPWWGWSKGKSALEWLFWAGDITSAGRGPNFERRYDLPERVLPAEVLDAPTPAVEDAHRQLLLRAAAHHGIGTAADLCNYFRLNIPRSRSALAELVEEGRFLPVEVEGWRDVAYLDPSARVPRRIAARALLSPFDSLVWERARAERLFGAKIRIELYTPAHKRVHGYYVLPFLLGEAIVARVDLKSDRKTGRLLVQAAWIEPSQLGQIAPDEIAVELAAELELMAEWLGLDEISVARRGDLSVALARRL